MYVAIKTVNRELVLREITVKIDRAIVDGYLDIEYNYRFPFLVFTDRGWEIEKDTYFDDYEVLESYYKVNRIGRELWYFEKENNLPA